MANKNQSPIWMWLCGVLVLVIVAGIPLVASAIGTKQIVTRHDTRLEKLENAFVQQVNINHAMDKRATRLEDRAGLSP